MNPYVDQFGNKTWFKDGKRHRLDGPASEYVDGTKFCYKDGRRHRLDVPAMEWSDGEKHWYYEGKWIDCKNQEEFERLINLRAFW